jgi:flagellar biosynthesis repressor protein FlbT
LPPQEALQGLWERRLARPVDDSWRSRAGVVATAAVNLKLPSVLPYPYFSKFVFRQETTTMPLRVELKPFERVVIGDSVIVNSDTRSSFLVEGDVPVLRERDMVTEDSATTPVRRLYYLVQMTYLKGDPGRYRTLCTDVTAELRARMPGSRDLIDAVERNVGAGAFYRALKDIRTLMRHEENELTADLECRR